jgi:hypothetical protein
MARKVMKDKDEPYYVRTPAKGKWWDGYAGEKNIIMEEFRGQLPFGYLLNLLDRYDCPVEYKGGTTEFVGTHIIITVPKHPKYWYNCDHQDKVDQLQRRISMSLEFTEVFENR